MSGHYVPLYRSLLLLLTRRDGPSFAPSETDALGVTSGIFSQVQSPKTFQHPGDFDQVHGKTDYFYCALIGLSLLRLDGCPTWIRTMTR